MRKLFRKHHGRESQAIGGASPAESEGANKPASTGASTQPAAPNVAKQVTPPSGLRLLHDPDGDRAAVDIVFIHGLMGHRENSWTADNMTEPWPKVLLPSELPNARILAYGYDARVTSPKEMVSVSRIRDHASTFLTRLANYRAKDDKEERPLIFVCHSLGGLLCKAALVRSHHRPEPHLSSVAESTRGILFLGTPHHGSALAVWADRFSRSVGILKQTNPNIVDLLRPDSEVLAEIQDSFHTMLQQVDIEITCFFEELPIVGIGLVVPQDSAIVPGKGCLGIHGNHRSMAKFTGPDDPGFVDVCGELRRFTKSMNRSKLITSSPLNPLVSSSIQTGTATGQQDHAGNGGVAHFIVPYRKNKNFVGRSDVFERLKRTFCHEPQYDMNDAEPRACIYGLGGVGKTQIALSYVHWLRKSRPDMSILWVYASNEDRFKQAFASIAETLGIPNRQSPSVNILALVKDWLERSDHGSWFMVIDNADNLELFCPPPSLSQPGPESNGGLARFIPDCDHGSVLITTRDKQTGVRLSKGHPPLEIEAMSSDESAEMIRKFSGDSSSQLIDADILALSNRLENLPLALAQAAAFIQENSISIARYLEILAESDDALLGLLSQDFEAVGRESGIPHAIMATWAVSFNEIQRRDPLADKLLSFITSFDRQAIPRQLLTAYIKSLPGENASMLLDNDKCVAMRGPLENENEHREFTHSSIIRKNVDRDSCPSIRNEGKRKTSSVDLEKALGVLKAFCFVSESKDQSIDMHRLIHLATKRSLDEKNMSAHFAGKALQALSMVFPTDAPVNFELCSKMIPHAGSVLGSKIEDTPQNNSSKALLRGNVACFYGSFGQHNIAVEHLEASLSEAKYKLDEKHPHVLGNMQLLASSLGELGRTEEAKRIISKVMVLQGEMYPHNHPAMIQSLGIYAHLYHTEKNLEVAKGLLKTAFHRCETVPGAVHALQATIVSDLGKVLIEFGESTMAYEICARAVDLTRRLYGSSHPVLLRSVANQAQLLRQQGDYLQAEEVCLQALQDDLMGFQTSELYVELVRCKSELGLSLCHQCKFEEAERALVGALEILTDHVDGGKGPMTVQLMGNRALIQEKGGRLVEAETTMKQVVHLSTRMAEHEYPRLPLYRADLARIQRSGVQDVESAESGQGESLRVIDKKWKPLPQIRSVLWPSNPFSI